VSRIATLNTRRSRANSRLMVAGLILASRSVRNRSSSAGVRSSSAPGHPLLPSIPVPVVVPPGSLAFVVLEVLVNHIGQEVAHGLGPMLRAGFQPLRARSDHPLGSQGKRYWAASHTVVGLAHTTGDTDKRRTRSDSRTRPRSPRPWCCRALPERFSARAIREGRKLEALIQEILESAASEPVTTTRPTRESR
jgi:hypothetical protein